MKPKKYTQEVKKENLSLNSLRRFKIICTENFLSEAKGLAKKYPSIKDDFMKLRDQLRIDPVSGNDSLGRELFKVRMQISDKNRGQSGGARVIIQVKIIENVVYVVSVYDKSVLETLIDAALTKLLKKCGLQ